MLGLTAKFRTLRKHIDHRTIDRVQKQVKRKEYRHIQRLRRIWTEGNFAIMKQKHNLIKTYKRGIEKLQEQCLFSALALNLKRMVKTKVATV